MGPYLCIASNGVPPTVSKRIILLVQCEFTKFFYPLLGYQISYQLYQISAVPPSISVPNQLIGAQEGQRVTLECIFEAFPKPINYWTRDKNLIIPQGKIIPETMAKIAIIKK